MTSAEAREKWQAAPDEVHLLDVRTPEEFRMDKYELTELMDESRFYPTNRHATAAIRQAAE